MTERLLTIFISAISLLISCKHPSSSQDHKSELVTASKDTVLGGNSIVYKSDILIIERLSDHIYKHTSFLTTNDFGKVDCNGMIVVNENEAVIFDTPSDDEGSRELIDYLVKDLRFRIKAIIPTHFHEDCVGGMEVFNEFGIPAYACGRTIDLLKDKGRIFSKPIEGFTDSIALKVGNKSVYAGYFGEGHTRDNIVGYFPGDEAIFGGCLIKAAGASQGNLEDANTAEWPETVRKLKQKYPQARIVIPGHGGSGGIELLDYTIKLFE